MQLSLDKADTTMASWWGRNSAISAPVIDRNWSSHSRLGAAPQQAMAQASSASALARRWIRVGMLSAVNSRSHSGVGV